MCCSWVYTRREIAPESADPTKYSSSSESIDVWCFFFFKGQASLIFGHLLHLHWLYVKMLFLIKVIFFFVFAGLASQDGPEGNKPPPRPPSISWGNAWEVLSCPKSEQDSLPCQESWWVLLCLFYFHKNPNNKSRRSQNRKHALKNMQKVHLFLLVC